MKKDKFSNIYHTHVVKGMLSMLHHMFQCYSSGAIPALTEGVHMLPHAQSCAGLSTFKSIVVALCPL